MFHDARVGVRCEALLRLTRMSLRCLPFFCLFAIAVAAHAGGPRFVAGTAYFDPAVAGQPVLWPAGTVAYYVDQGDLSPAVSHAAAVATVAAAAAVWNGVPTAAVSIAQAGILAEDVSGANVFSTANGLVLPADIENTAIATPVAVVFDADGSVIDAFYGTHASDPDDCVDNGVLSLVDNLTTSGTIAHALVLVNGRCTGSAPQLMQIQFQLERAFGRVLGLDWSQANDAILFGPGEPSYQQLQGWPLMRPIDINCNQLSVECIPDPLELRADDIASIGRLYPVTSANLPQHAGKTLTATATLSIHGTASFRRGQGMQGVNVVARPLIPGIALPNDRYPATSVTGYLYTGNRGNPITSPQLQFGSLDPTTEGSYSIAGIPLPLGAVQADYIVTLEAINPLYTANDSVGPYVLGSPAPSGTLASVVLHGLTAGMSVEQGFILADSAADEQPGSSGTVFAPTTIQPSGEWHGRIASPGQAEWFQIPVQGGRHFTLEAQALNEDPASSQITNTGSPAENKLRPLLGIWNATSNLADAPGLPANAAIAPFNSPAPGLTALAVDTIASGELLLGIADQRGDGRPDYLYHGRLLYAASVTPTHLPLAGGVLTLTGSGFRTGMVSTLGANITATVTEITPTLVTAIVPPVAAPTGSLDLVLTDPVTHGIAAIAGGISYGAASGDVLSIAAAPPADVGTGLPAAFTVRVFGPDQTTPVGGVAVLFTVLAGAVTLGSCADAACSANQTTEPQNAVTQTTEPRNAVTQATVTSTGDGYATMLITPNLPGPIKVQAALTNGNTLFTEFTATAPPSLAALSAPLFLAPSATWDWSPQVQVLPQTANTPITWSAPAIQFATTTFTNAQGVASTTLTLGPWAAGTAFTLTACAQSCVTLPVTTVHAETQLLSAISGTVQMLAPGQPAAPILLRLLAPAGQPIVAGTVSLSAVLRAWSPPCAAAGPCPPGRWIATSTQSAKSAADGSVAFNLAIPSGLPAVFAGQATAASGATVPIRIEIHP